MTTSSQRRADTRAAGLRAEVGRKEMWLWREGLDLGVFIPRAEKSTDINPDSLMVSGVQET